MDLPLIEVFPYFYESLACCVLGSLLWWAHRLGSQRVLLPILRIRSENLETQNRKHWIWKLPPLIPWISFSALCCCFLGFLLQPFTWKREPIPTQKPHPIHVLFDVSPSVSAKVSWDQLTKNGQTLLQEASSHTQKITFSTSDDLEIHDFQSLSAYQKHMHTKNFSQKNYELYQIVSYLKKSLNELPVLIIVSDRDHHTWKEFLKHLQPPEYARVFRVEPGQEPTKTNLFFKKIQKTNHQWHLFVEQTKPSRVSEQISIVLKHGSQILWSQYITLPENAQSIEVKAIPPKIPFDPENQQFTWTLTPQTPDAIELDNHITTQADFLPPIAVVYASNQSENALTNSTYFFVKALESLGFSVSLKESSSHPAYAVRFDLDKNTLNSMPMTTPLNPDHHLDRLTNLYKLLSQSNLLPTLDEKLQQERVPYEESNHKEADPSELASLWAPQTQEKSVNKQNIDWILLKDSKPFLLWMYIFVLLSFGLEVLWNIARSLASKGFWVILLAIVLSPTPEAKAHVTLAVYPSIFDGEFLPLRTLVEARTSVSLNPTPKILSDINSQTLKEPWLWLRNTSIAQDSQTGRLKPDLESWIRKGGFLIGLGTLTPKERGELTNFLTQNPLKHADWREIDDQHLLRKTFFILKTLPSEGPWFAFHYEDRVAILLIDKDLLATPNPINAELSQRAFINILMLALTNDYKSDSLHIRELLKRGI